MSTSQKHGTEDGGRKLQEWAKVHPYRANILQRASAVSIPEWTRRRLDDTLTDHRLVQFVGPRRICHTRKERSFVEAFLRLCIDWMHYEDDNFVPMTDQDIMIVHHLTGGTGMSPNTCVSMRERYIRRGPVPPSRFELASLARRGKIGVTSVYRMTGALALLERPGAPSPGVPAVTTKSQSPQTMMT